ncbi:hypothetical protein PENSPDRAFT_735710 [Peniophora sp. CONT]|nr:hypothetical protein PENSPDRAFT_735710 [Peniophora sp. CONT]
MSSSSDRLILRLERYTETEPFSMLMDLVLLNKDEDRRVGVLVARGVQIIRKLACATHERQVRAANQILLTETLRLVDTHPTSNAGKKAKVSFLGVYEEFASLAPLEQSLEDERTAWLDLLKQNVDFVPLWEVGIDAIDEATAWWLDMDVAPLHPSASNEAQPRLALSTVNGGSDALDRSPPMTPTRPFLAPSGSALSPISIASSSPSSPSPSRQSFPLPDAFTSETPLHSIPTGPALHASATHPTHPTLAPEDDDSEPEVVVDVPKPHRSVAMQGTAATSGVEDIDVIPELDSAAKKGKGRAVHDSRTQPPRHSRSAVTSIAPVNVDDSDKDGVDSENQSASRETNRRETKVKVKVPVARGPNDKPRSVSQWKTQGWPVYYKYDPYGAEKALDEGELIDDKHLGAYPEMSGLPRDWTAYYKVACKACAVHDAMCIFRPPQLNLEGEWSLKSGLACLACKRSREKCSLMDNPENITPRTLQHSIAWLVDTPSQANTKRQFANIPPPKMAIRINKIHELIENGRYAAWPAYLVSDGPKKGWFIPGEGAPEPEDKISTLFRLGCLYPDKEDYPFKAAKGNNSKRNIDLSAESSPDSANKTRPRAKRLRSRASPADALFPEHGGKVGSDARADKLGS